MTLMTAPPGGRFGDFGGRYVPESLVPACAALAEAFREAWADPAFRDELDELLAVYAGRPTPLTPAAQPLRRARRHAAAQARGPGAHRLPQDQQRARPGAARPPDGPHAG